VHVSVLSIAASKVFQKRKQMNRQNRKFYTKKHVEPALKKMSIDFKTCQMHKSLRFWTICAVHFFIICTQFCIDSKLPKSLTPTLWFY